MIDKLRSILLMEADYNANNKELIGNRMMAVVREYGLMMDEIFSKMGRMAEDGAQSKILIYDIVRQSRLLVAIFSVDASNCYDSIAHAIASLIFQACRVPRGRCKAFSNTGDEVLPTKSIWGLQELKRIQDRSEVSRIVPGQRSCTCWLGRY